MIHPRILYNGHVCSASEKLLCPGQLGLLSGWGVFTTLRVYDGIPFAFARHWARMSKDAALMHVPMPEDPAAIERDLYGLIEANSAVNASLRLVVVRNRHGLWEGPANTRDYDVIALTAGLNQWPHDVKLALMANARYAACEFTGAKILSWAQNLTWNEEAHSRGWDEMLLLNERGEVSECTSANLFAAYGDEVRTPPLNSGCLPGVTRDVLLREIHVPGLRVVEQTLFPADLEKADQVFITSTTRHLLPVSSIEGLSMRNQGAACQRLREAFDAYVREYTASRRAAVV
ncbi:MAG: aminotransferase class IV [Acidobacteriales bacterium]|nr:aminotransferase class IV [Terriglobales bacterium]